MEDDDEEIYGDLKEIKECIKKNGYYINAPTIEEIENAKKVGKKIPYIQILMKRLIKQGDKKND